MTAAERVALLRKTRDDIRAALAIDKNGDALQWPLQDTLEAIVPNYDPERAGDCLDPVAEAVEFLVSYAAGNRWDDEHEYPETMLARLDEAGLAEVARRLADANVPTAGA